MFKYVSHTELIQMLMIQSNDCVYNFLEPFPLKLNLSIKSFLLLDLPSAAGLMSVVVIFLSSPCARSCLSFSGQIRYALSMCTESYLMVHPTLQRQAGNKQKEEPIIMGALGV